MNKVCLSGRLTKDVELRNTSKRDVVTFTVAVQREYKNQIGKYDSDFIQCKAFGNTAKFISEYFKKGDGIEITGNINTSSFTNDKGEKIYTTAVVVDSVHFTLSNKKEEKQEEDEFPF